MCAEDRSTNRVKVRRRLKQLSRLQCLPEPLSQPSKRWTGRFGPEAVGSHRFTQIGSMSENETTPESTQDLPHVVEKSSGVTIQAVFGYACRTWNMTRTTDSTEAMTKRI